MADSKKKNTCILHGDMIEYIRGDDALSDSQTAELFRAYLSYINNEDVVITDAEVKGIWRMAKSQIDRDNTAYAERCKKAAENIKKRYEQKVAEAATEVAMEYGCSSDKAENVVSITEAVAKDEKPKRKKTAAVGTAELIDSFEFEPEVKAVVTDWLEYKKERKEDYKPTGLKSLCSQIKNNINEYGVEKVVGIIKLSMASNYAGILWARVNDQPKHRQTVSDGVSNEYLKRWGLA